MQVQRGNIPGAVAYFDKALNLARTELELTHLVSLKIAALTQVGTVAICDTKGYY